LNNRDSFRENLLACLGGVWPEPPDLEPEVVDSIPRDGYRLEKVTYQVEPGERVSAYVLIPDGVSPPRRTPGIAIWHQHAGRFDLGKSEPAGVVGDPMHFTGPALAREGYVVLCPDAICFEERQDSVLRAADFERFTFLRYLVNGKCLAWKNILDMRRAIDYLSSRPEVNPDSIGCYGHSLGSTFTWLVGPWEPRLKCLVGNCCLPTYTAIHRLHLTHSFSNFIPGLHQYGDTPEIAALIAPGPLHLNFGTGDRLSPIPEVRRAIESIGRAYSDCDASDNFTSLIEDGQGHVLSERMWQETRSKFLKHLPV
jgi:dienelactone hydrolase